LRKPVFTDVLQVGFVVRDLDASMRTLSERYGIGPWKTVEFLDGDAQDLVKDDEPASYAIRIAFAEVGRLQWELIQPLDDRSNYAEFLAEHGEGVHHLKMAVENYDETVAELRGRGHRVLIGGNFRGTDLVYLSTERDLGVIAEIVDDSGANGAE